MSEAGGVLACHDCDLLQRLPTLHAGDVVVCPRCAAVLLRHNPGHRERTLCLTIAAAILFVISNAFAIVSIEIQGNRNASTLFGAVLTLWQDGMTLVSGLVFFTTILGPGLEIVLMILVLTPARPAPAALRLLQAIRPWAMLEVFMLGLLVSVQKLSHLANIVPGVALWSFAVLMLLFSAFTATFNAHDLWRAVSEQFADVDTP
jgi:paraquat-inducible protein A